MLPPDFFTQARMNAPHFIQGRVLGWDGQLAVRVTRVFRGTLRRGARLSLLVSVRGDAPLRAGDPTLWFDEQTIRSARYVEAFLDGDPPSLVCDQIKFLRFAWWWPSGDPAKEGFGW